MIVIEKSSYVQNVCCSEEILKYIRENSIIDLSAIEQQIEMNKIKKFVGEKHKGKIWKGKDGRWRTHVYIEGRRVLKVKTSEVDLYDWLYQFYTSDGSSGIKLTFGEMFDRFKEYKSNLVAENTICKYEYDYARFFAETEFSKMDVTVITEEDISLFLVKRIKELKLKKKAYEALFGYIKATMKYCKNHRIISENPADFIERKDFYKYCENTYVNPKDRIVSDKEMSMIKNKIHHDREERPNYIVAYAVELASYTGMRVGELAALTWDVIDFENHTITIDKAEIYKLKSKEYVIGKTKNYSIRIIPMTDKIEKLLLEIKKVEMKYGYFCEYVFANEDGRIHKTAITRCAGNKSLQAGIEKPKSIHSFRRTINSRLKMNGVSTTTAAALLGHTEKVNEGFYTYDVSDMRYKREMLEKASGV